MGASWKNTKTILRLLKKAKLKIENLNTEIAFAK